MAFVINPAKDLVNIQSMTNALFQNENQVVDFVSLSKSDDLNSGKTHAIKGKGVISGSLLTYVYNRIAIVQLFGVCPVIRGTYAPLTDGVLTIETMCAWLSKKYGVEIDFKAGLFEVEQLSITQYQLSATESNPLVEGAIVFEYLHPLDCIFNDTKVAWSLNPVIALPHYEPISILHTDKPATAQRWTCPSLILGVDPSTEGACHIHKTASSNQVNRVAMPKGVSIASIQLRADVTTPEEGYLAQCVLALGGKRTPRVEVSKHGCSIQSGNDKYYFKHDFTRYTTLEILRGDSYSVFINGKCIAADVTFTDEPMPVDNFILTDFSESGYKHNHYFYIVSIDVGVL